MDKEWKTLDEWYKELQLIAENRRYAYLLDKKEEYETLYKMGKTPNEIFQCELNLYEFISMDENREKTENE